MSDMRRLVALLVLLGVGSAWSTPCPPASAPTRDAARWATHAVAGHAEHPLHHLHRERSARAGADEQSLRAQCPCRCGDLPPAAGTSARHGEALLLALTEAPEPPEAGAPAVAAEHAPQLLPDPIDHIPIPS